MTSIAKYPRTPHVEGSRLQPGDDDLTQVPLQALAGAHVVVEEKLDGANAGLSFDTGGALLLQSRGHYLTGGQRERHFALFKSWAQVHRAALHARLGARYVVYGEWLFAKHTIFYDALPHYFLEFDVLDRDRGVFLSTDARRRLLEGLPLCSVPVLAEGAIAGLDALRALVQYSLYKTPDWCARLAAVARAQGYDSARAAHETDPTGLAEGLYLKIERDGAVQRRLKFIRASFATTVLETGDHWLDRTILPNELAAGVDLFATGS